MPFNPLVKPPSRRFNAVPQKRSTVGVSFPAQVGGINAMDSVRALPPTDAINIYNMIPYRYGLRTRSGYRDWQVGVGAIEDTERPGIYPDGPATGAWLGNIPYGVRTLIAFTGSASDGSNDRLFAACEDGIYDVTTFRGTPVKKFSFPTSSDGTTVRGSPKAGYGVYTAFTNNASRHYIAYTDGLMGYMLYSEGTDAWTQVTAGTGDGQIDTTGGKPDPGSFRFVMSWKNKLWFATESSSTAWYLPTSQFAGAINPIYFGSRFRYGGSLVGLWSWTVDGGAGIDDLLVGISSSGDVVIYEGTDPSIPGAFQLRGVWWIGEVPPGRNIASDFGGDLFVLSRLGCLPLSKLVAGGIIRDPNIYATQKIANIFNDLMTERGNIAGWSLKLHPADNLLLINVPASPSKPIMQMAMSMASHGWTQLTGLPIMCMEPWHGKMYFGTWDNRICVNEGPVDNQDFTGTTFKSINFALLSSYQQFDSSAKKRCHMVRPIFSSTSTPPFFTTQARFDYNLTDLQLSTQTGTIAGGWDVGVWDINKWDQGSNQSQGQYGTTGMGSSIAVLITGTSSAETTLLGFDMMVEQGGLL